MKVKVTVITASKGCKTCSSHLTQFCLKFNFACDSCKIISPAHFIFRRKQNFLLN